MTGWETVYGDRDTDLHALSDTLGTWEKCHCNQIVTVSRGNLLTSQLVGTCSKCHCKLGVTLICVTISGEICTINANQGLPSLSLQVTEVCLHRVPSNVCGLLS